MYRKQDVSLVEFKLGLRRYVDEHKNIITPQLDVSAVFGGSERGSQGSLQSVGSSSTDVVMPPPPPPPQPVDDLANRKLIVLHNAASKAADKPMLQFYVSESLSVEVRRIQRVANDPSAGSFFVINFCRVGANGKKYDFSFVESYGGDLFEACLYFMQSATKPKLVLLPPERLTMIDKKGYDVSRLGDDDYPQIAYKVADLRVFMLYKLGCWHMMIRKYKSKVKKC